MTVRAGTGLASSPADASARYAELDGVRGLAIALTILCNSVLLSWGGSTAQKFWLLFANAGWVGVQLFFVLSGFLITNILLRSRGRETYFRDFYARRALRILPPYFLVLIVVMLAYRLKGHYLDNPLCYWLFVSNFCIAYQERWGDFGVSWSLAVEEHFYLLWPVIVAMLPLHRLTVFAWSILVGSLLLRYAMSAYGVSPIAIYTITPTRLDGLAAGALIAIALNNSVRPQVMQRIRYLLIATGVTSIVVTLVLARNFNYDDTLVQTLGFTGITAVSAALIQILIFEGDARKSVRRLLRFRTLTTLGFYSYAIYLFHPFVVGWLRQLPFFEAASRPDFHGHAIMAQAVFTLAISVLTFALAFLSYHLFEKKFLDLGRHFRTVPQSPVNASERAA